MDIREIFEGDLEKVSGGFDVSPVSLQSYVCPICGETHTITIKRNDTGVGDAIKILDYSVCAQTLSISFIFDARRPECMGIVSRDGKYYPLMAADITFVRFL